MRRLRSPKRPKEPKTVKRSQPYKSQVPDPPFISVTRISRNIEQIIVTLSQMEPMHRPRDTRLEIRPNLLEDTKNHANLHMRVKSYKWLELHLRCDRRHETKIFSSSRTFHVP